jgi:hypothetical protein
VVQPLLVTSSALNLATECVRMILKVRARAGTRAVSACLLVVPAGACRSRTGGASTAGPSKVPSCSGMSQPGVSAVQVFVFAPVVPLANSPVAAVVAAAALAHRLMTSSPPGNTYWQSGDAVAAAVNRGGRSTPGRMMDLAARGCGPGAAACNKGLPVAVQRRCSVASQLISRESRPRFLEVVGYRLVFTQCTSLCTEVMYTLATSCKPSPTQAA